MDYIEYLKLLKDNNIELFDYDKRISFYNLNYYKIQNIQTGGGNSKYLNSKSKDELINIINISLSSNPQNLFSLLNFY